MISSYAYVDRGRLALRGADRVRFLHGMVTADVEKIGDGGGSRAAMLSVKGRLLAELTIYGTGDELLLSLDLSLRDKVRTLLDKHIVMDDVELVERSDELDELGLYGDEAAASIAAALGVDRALLEALPPYHHLLAGGVRVARDPALGGVGYRLFAAPGALAGVAAGSTPLSAEHRELRRIEAGTARYGLDLDEDRLVVEANLEDAISFDKGCYLGQEVVVRATTRGRVNRKLVGLVLEAEVPRGAALRTEAQPEAGVVTSVTRSERFGPIALAYVHRAALDADVTLTIDASTRARVVALPFAPASVEAARDRLRLEPRV